MKTIHLYLSTELNAQKLKDFCTNLPFEWHQLLEEWSFLDSPAVIITGDPSIHVSPGYGLCTIGSDPVPGPGRFSLPSLDDGDSFIRGIFSILPDISTTTEDQYVAEFVDIGIQLAAERDLDRLLELILTRVRELTVSDAASLYLVEGEEEDRHLIFKLAQNISRPIKLQEMRLPLSEKSLAGYVACTREPLIIEDAYEIPLDAPYSINKSFDKNNNYRSKSMLVIPMINHRDEIIGVLQLINRKPSQDLIFDIPTKAEFHVLPYTDEIQEKTTALANLAAVAIENNQLYENIRRLFDGFVQASVTAIEQRDPSTKGHSLRVSVLSVELARAVDNLDGGPFRDIVFSKEMLQELKWAGLLHDFGKVGVREQVLVKAEKLYPFELERIESRFRYIKKCVEVDMLKEKLAFMETSGGKGREEFYKKVDARIEETYRRLEEFIDCVRAANLPTVLPEEKSHLLKEIREWIYSTSAGESLAALTEPEIAMLSIPKGSLNDREREEIESHVTHTFHFLEKIPWTNELKQIPEITYAHHEKLNGRGYPRKLSAQDIPIQSKIMAIADIFDALSAADRPYKKAVPVERSLDILKMEADGGMLDPDLVRLFIDGKVWESTLHLRSSTS